MIRNNEKKCLSRDCKRRILRRMKMVNNMKLLLDKIKSEKRKKNKIFDKFKQLENELVRIKCAK